MYTAYRYYYNILIYASLSLFVHSTFRRLKKCRWNICLMFSSPLERLSGKCVKDLCDILIKLPKCALTSFVEINKFCGPRNKSEAWIVSAAKAVNLSQPLLWANFLYSRKIFSLTLIKLSYLMKDYYRHYFKMVLCAISTIIFLKNCI